MSSMLFDRSKRVKRLLRSSSGKEREPSPQPISKIFFGFAPRTKCFTVSTRILISYAVFCLKKKKTSKAVLNHIWLTSFISFFSLIYYSEGYPDQTKHLFDGG